jgi:hypothetical protein
MKNSKAMLSIVFFIVVRKVQQHMLQTFAKALNGKKNRANQSTIIIQLSLILYVT